MTMYHKNLSPERWFKFTLMEQLANVGSDIVRTINWRNKGDLEQSQKAFYRALELIDLTVADLKNRKRLKEVLRARELLVDYFLYDNVYCSTDELWQKYFFNFNYAAAVQKGR